MQKQKLETPSEWIDFNLRAVDFGPLPESESSLRGSCRCPYPGTWAHRGHGRRWRRSRGHLPAGEPRAGTREGQRASHSAVSGIPDSLPVL